MNKHHNGQNSDTTGPAFGKKDLLPKDDPRTPHVDDKDFKKGGSTTDPRGDEDGV